MVVGMGTSAIDVGLGWKVRRGCYLRFFLVSWFGLLCHRYF
jgi:hypothetical protein